MPNDEPAFDAVRTEGFQTTQWGLVISAQRGDAKEGGEVLEKLCRAYWKPVYAFVLRQEYDLHSAQELTREFFSRILQKSAFDPVDSSKGRFRSFLLASLKHFMASEWDRSTGFKRGGGWKIFSLEPDFAERDCLTNQAKSFAPELLYDKRWAETIVERVVARLRSEYGPGERTERFDALKSCLLLELDPKAYSELAEKMTLTEAGVRSAVFRMRRRFRELFRNEIAHTVASPEDIDDEIRDLFRMLNT